MNKIAVCYEMDGSGDTVLFDLDADSEVLRAPQGASVVDNFADFVNWRRGSFCRTYIFGAHTANMVYTEQEALLRMFIRPPSCPIVNSAVPVNNECGVVVAAGPGLTGSCIVALRWFDSLHNRRSPLSAVSPAIVLANQGVTFYAAPSVPRPDDDYVDTLEVWVSVDGGLFRHWDSIDIGVASFTVNETATGEAYTTELTELPICAFGDMANDRLFTAGDPKNPQLIYISEASAPEEYSGLSIPTRFGEPVIGLKNLGGTIYVQCPASSYYIQAFGPTDFVMRPLKPKIGGFGQATIVLFDDIGLIPTQRGLYVCNGTSMVPLGEGVWAETWRRTVSDPLRRAPYEGGFAVADFVAGVIKFKPRPPMVDSGELTTPKIIGYPDDHENDYWVWPFEGIVPEAGGAGQANLTFDQNNGSPHTCAAMLYDPDSSVGALYTGDEDGNILLENQAHKVDKKDVATVETAVALRFLFHTPHHIIGQIGNADDSFKTTDVGVILQNENLAGTLGTYTGNEFAYMTGVQNSPNFGPVESFTIPAGREEPPDVATENALVPRDRFVKQDLQRGAGTCVSVRVTITQDADDPGAGTGDVEQDSEVAFTGWFFIASDGSEKRPLAPWTDPSP